MKEKNVMQLRYKLAHIEACLLSDYYISVLSDIGIKDELIKMNDSIKQILNDEK